MLRDKKFVGDNVRFFVRRFTRSVGDRIRKKLLGVFFGGWIQSAGPPENRDRMIGYHR
jgi:hypothetical protein